MIKKVSLAIGALSLSMCMAAHAVIEVNPLVVFFNGKGNVQDITVKNDDNAVAYVEVTPRSVQNTGMMNETLTAYQMGGDASSFGIMVSPLKMAIPANGTRRVRIVALKTNPAEDAIYYLRFSQVSSLTVDDSANKEGNSVNMTNGISYRVQTVILPAKPMPQISMARNGSQVTVKNTGNSYASLRNGQVCNAQGSECTNLPANLSYKVLYAGNTWTFNAPKAGMVKFDVIYAQDKKMAAASN
jgi:P pilus assembly chaperone PapD